MNTKLSNNYYVLLVVLISKNTSVEIRETNRKYLLVMLFLETDTKGREEETHKIPFKQ